MAEDLSIQIDTTEAKAALDALKQSFIDTGATIQAFATDGTSALSRLSDAMSGIKGFDANVVTGITSLGSAMDSLQSTNIDSIAEGLTKLAAVDATAVAQSVKDLAEALKDIKFPDGLEKIGEALKVQEQATRAAQRATKEATVTNTEMSRAVQTFGRELLNATGFIGGFGVRVGSLVMSFQTMVQGAGSVSGALKEVASSIGGLTTAFGLVSVGIQAIQNVVATITSMITPILEVTDKFDKLRVAINSFEGEGAGEAALASLKDIAQSTGISMDALADNFKTFRVAANDANITAQKANSIFQAFASVATATGQSASQTSQMMNTLSSALERGTLTTRELKTQFAQLPGMTKIFADALGTTTTGLADMAKNGLPAASTLEKVAAAIEKNPAVLKALEQQLKGTGAAFAAFSDSVGAVLQSLGEGNFGGIAAGIANGMQTIAKALNSEGLLMFTRILGDLFGLLINVGLSAIGGFIDGLMAIPNALAALGSAVADLASNFSGLLESIPGVSAIMAALPSSFEAVSGAARGVGLALGALVAVFALLKIEAMIAGFIALATESVVLTTAFGTLTAGVEALTVAMLANPWVAAGAAIVILGVAAYELYKNYSQVKTASDELTASTDLLVSSQQNVTQHIDSFNQSLASGTSEIYAAAAAYNSLEAAQAQGAIAIQGIKDAISQLDQEQKNATESSRKFNEMGSSYIEGINDKNDALQDNKRAIQEDIEHQNEMNRLTGNTIDTTGHYKRALKQIDEQIRANNKEIKAAQRLMADRKKADDDAKRASDQHKEALKKQEEEQNKYGGALSSSSGKLADYLIKLGLSKDEAINLAHATDIGTTSYDNNAAAMDRRFEKAKQLIRVGQEQIEKINQEKDATLERMRANGASKEDMDNVTETARRQAAVWDDMIGKQVDVATKTGAMSSQYQKFGSIGKAGEQVSKDLNAEFGTQASNIDVVKEAMEEMNPSLDKGKDANDKLEDASKKAGDKIGDTGEAAKKMAGDMKKAATETKTSSDEIIGATDAWIAFATPVKEASSSMSSLANSLPTVSKALPTMADGLTKSVEPLPVFVDGFERLAKVSTPLATDFTAIGLAFTNIAATVAGTAETLPPFVDAILKISGAGPGVSSATTSLGELITKINDSADQIETAAGSLKSLVDTIGKLYEDAGKAGSGVQPLITALDAVVAATRRAIEAFKDMKKAADEAFRAAEKANGASSGGGSDGGSTGANANREGGYSETSLSKMSVPSASFNNAPHLAEGVENTNKFMRTVGGGGIPSVLHPNEAVVPLSRGREIPVSVNLKSDPAPTLAAPSSSGSGLQTSISGLNEAIRALGDGVETLSKNALRTPDISIPPITVQMPSPAASTTPERQTVPDNQTFVEPPTATNRSATNNERRSAPTVNIVVHATDADSFRRTQDQIVRELSRKIARADRRGG